MIEISESFRKFGLSFRHLDILDNQTAEAVLADALRRLSVDERASLRRFIDGVLNADYSDEELLAIWLQSKAIIYPTDGTVRAAFASIRATIDNDCNPYYSPLD